METFAKAASSSRLDTYDSDRIELRQTSNFATVAMPILLKDEVKDAGDIKQKWKKYLVTKKIRKVDIEQEDYTAIDKPKSQRFQERIAAQ